MMHSGSAPTENDAGRRRGDRQQEGGQGLAGKLEDVAAVSGVSRSTVSRVLNGPLGAMGHGVEGSEEEEDAMATAEADTTVVTDE